MEEKICSINIKPDTPGQHGLPKLPVNSTRIIRNGLEGDYNRYRHIKKKNDPDMAVLLLPMEIIEELNEEGWSIKPGDLGENLTTAGIAIKDFSPGKTYRVGEATIQITFKCEPCTNLYSLPYVGREKGPEFMKTMMDRRGWYASVNEEGQVNVGDKVVEIL